MANHSIVHLDIPAGDPAIEAQFFGVVFDWQLIHHEEFDYWMFSTAVGPGGGFVQAGEDVSGAGPPYRIGEVRVYIGTDDIDASLAAVEAHGGKALGAKVDMGSYGAYAFFSDPAGNTIGLFKAGAPAS